MLVTKCGMRPRIASKFRSVAVLMPNRPFNSNLCALPRSKPQVLHRNLRSKQQFSSLGNPMFPQKTEDDLGQVLKRVDDRNQKDDWKSSSTGDNSKKQMNNDTIGSKTFDILSDHGGKVALVAFGIAIALFYSYYQSGQDRIKIEEEALHDAAIEPYEIVELRYVNNLSKQQYAIAVASCLVQFPSKMCSYAEFVSFLRTNEATRGLQFRSMHLLDRLVMQRIANNSYTVIPLLQNENSPEFTVNEQVITVDGTQEKPWYDVPLPLDFLLVALNLVMQDTGSGRAESLFDMVATLSQPSSESMPSEYSSENVHEDRVEKNAELASAILSTERTAPVNSGDQQVSVMPLTDGECTVANNTEKQISKSQVQRLLQCMIDTDQIPPEKQVIETGIKYPIRTHRRKTPADMIRQYEDGESKATKTQVVLSEESVTEEVFTKLLLSSPVCAWAECYRHKRDAF